MKSIGFVNRRLKKIVKTNTPKYSKYNYRKDYHIKIIYSKNQS